MSEDVTKDKDYRGKLLRLFRIVMLLTRSPLGVHITELSEKLGVTTRTVYRDLELLGQIGFAADELERGKYIIRGLEKETQKFEKNLQFTAEEAGILSQAVQSIANNHPMKKGLLEKLLTFSGMEDVLKVIVRHDISRNLEVLAKAVREKKQVHLRNYHSAHSGSISTRLVEPYAFSADGVFIKGFEHETLSNKTFKIERIEDVTMLDVKWRYEKRHEKTSVPDIFGINSGEKHWVKLSLSLRAARLLQEEYPLSRPYVNKEGTNTYLFHARINSFIGVSRFILGLCDEVEVLEPTALVDYLEKRISARKFANTTKESNLRQANSDQ
jgi:predicted DNA-binding transcriptional regulator YafY